jgi:hypothetical protein
VVEEVILRRVMEVVEVLLLRRVMEVVILWRVMEVVEVLLLRGVLGEGTMPLSLHHCLTEYVFVEVVQVHRQILSLTEAESCPLSGLSRAFSKENGCCW